MCHQICLCHHLYQQYCSTHAEMRKIFKVNVLHPNPIAWRHTYLEIWQLSKRDGRCLLQATKYTLHTVKGSYSCINLPTAYVELSRLLVTFELATVTITRGLGRQKVSRVRSFLLPLFSHLESVTEPKKVGSKVWGVGSSGSKHPLNAVALWQSAQSHHLVSEEKIQRGYIVGIHRRWC